MDSLLNSLLNSLLDSLIYFSKLIIIRYYCPVNGLVAVGYSSKPKFKSLDYDFTGSSSVKENILINIK